MGLVAYEAELDWDSPIDGNGVLSLNLFAPGVTHLGLLTGFALGTSAWYQLTLNCNGSNLTVVVQRLSDGYYLNSSGAWQAAAAVAITATDSSITGQGYGGLRIFDPAGLSQVFSDDFSFTAYTFSPSGGAVLGGTAVPGYSAAPTASGGAVLGGTAVPTLYTGFYVGGSGGAVAGGHWDGAVEVNFTPTPAGGVILGGTTGQPGFSLSPTPAGGCVEGRRPLRAWVTRPRRRVDASRGMPRCRRAARRPARPAEPSPAATTRLG